jgi:glycosyltransferase involved in cell wall biosynthesis
VSSPSKARLSVCIIAFDEEERLPACLASVAFADEIIVVDSHSTDRTRELAAEAGARVIERPFPGHVEQKNFAAAQASGEWVLSLDADERLSAALAREVQRVVAEDDPRFVAWEMPRCTWYLGRWIRHGAWYPDRKLRLWRRGSQITSSMIGARCRTWPSPPEPTSSCSPRSARRRKVRQRGAIAWAAWSSPRGIRARSTSSTSRGVSRSA